MGDITQDESDPRYANRLTGLLVLPGDQLPQSEYVGPAALADTDRHTINVCHLYRVTGEAFQGIQEAVEEASALIRRGSYLVDGHGMTTVIDVVYHPAFNAFYVLRVGSPLGYTLEPLFDTGFAEAGRTGEKVRGVSFIRDL